jgi:uncharacterized protein YcbK (DUF882 family)
MTLYSVNTKEKLTTTYMVNGRHVPAELKKINHLLRDWRRNAVTKMDTETIDLMWELHADLGSKAPIHIISGYRSAETNALLKSIGRNVAKRSMHIQGKAIDLYFPDVPTERVRNSALVREVGGVGYYPRSGASGFIHVDSGRVRHWPGIGSSQLARIRRDYRKTVGARLGRGQVQVASAETAEEGYPTPVPRPRPIEVLMMAAAQTVVQPAAAPAPVSNFAEAAARLEDSQAAMPALETKADLSVAQAFMGTKGDLAAAQVAQLSMQPKADLAAAQVAQVARVIEPVAAPVPIANFAANPSPARDTLGTELEPDLMIGQVVEATQANAGGKGDFLAALGDGIAAGAQDLLSWPAQLIRSAESLIWSGPSQAIASVREWPPVEEARDPFPPITEEDAAELEVIIAALRSRAAYDAQTAASAPAPRPDAKADRLSDIRARKGDLILTAPPPRYGAALAPQPVNQAVVQAFEKLLHETKSVE